MDFVCDVFLIPYQYTTFLVSVIVIYVCYVKIIFNMTVSIDILIFAFVVINLVKHKKH